MMYSYHLEIQLYQKLKGALRLTQSPFPQLEIILFLQQDSACLNLFSVEYTDEVNTIS